MTAIDIAQSGAAPTARRQARGAAPSLRDWLIPAGLILLAAVPAIAGGFRLTWLAGAAEVTPDSARYFADPMPVVIHIVGATLFCLLGAFQFPQGIRRRWPSWHRRAGRIVAPAGLAAALSGLWMTLFYPAAPLAGDLLVGFRLVFGAVMVLSIVLAVAAILRRDIVRHRAWMIRGYAIGIAAGTQAFIGIPWLLTVGEAGETTNALLLGAGWVINVAFAEWIIRGRPWPRRSSLD